MSSESSELVNSSLEHKIVKLQSNDGTIHEVQLEAARMSSVVAGLIDNLDYDSDKSDPIPLPNVAASELTKIIDFLVHHKEDKQTAEEFQELLLKDKVSDFDRDFIKIDKEDIINLYMASNYLDVKLLNELCAWSIAATIKGKNATEINKYWNMTCDFTEEELQKVKDGHAWIEQKD